MLEPQQRLGLAVAGLLTEVGSRCGPAVMPHEGPGGERDPAACLLQPPADVDVVARTMKLRIEAVDRFEHMAAKRHVAARHMLRHLIAFEHVRGLAGRGVDAGGEPAVVRGDVGATDGVGFRAIQLVH